jgi:replicative DNA helicase
MLLASLMAADTYVAEAMSVVSGDDFYREGHRAVFRAIEALFGAGEPVEPITVIERLTKDGELEAAGGRVGVLDLMETPFIAASFRTYAQIVRDAAVQRRLLQVGQQIEKMIAERDG